MLSSVFIRLSVVCVLMFGYSAISWGCDSCTIARLGREGTHGQTVSREGPWFVQYMYENQNWHEKEGGEAHRLHHQGHDVHAKTVEEFHHLTIGRRMNDRLSASVQIPYVMRHSLEVHDHAILGSKQKSEGLGDLKLLGDWRLRQDETSSLSVLGGIKFPTGAVNEENSIGDRFEQELQPGSGSYDYLVGGAYRKKYDRINWVGNMVYVFKTEGAQDYRFGDILSSSVIADYLLNPQGRLAKTRLGLDANIQYEQRHKDDGQTIKDSGGVSLFLGPIMNVKAGDSIGFTGTFLAPVAQDLGGVHQKVDFIWTLEAKVDW